MILQIVSSFLPLLLIIAFASILLFGFGVYLILSHFSKHDEAQAICVADDYTGIAGDDLFATQLDLARAYLETGNTEFAKSILKAVTQQGSLSQQEEAKRLLIHHT